MQLKKSLMIALTAGVALMGTAAYAQLATKGKAATERGIVNTKQNVTVIVASRIAHVVGAGFLHPGAQCSLRPGDKVEKFASVTDQGPNTVLARRLRTNLAIGVPDQTVCPGGTMFYTTGAFWDAWQKAEQAAAAAKAAAVSKKK